jgi:hypothetical protein
LTSSGCDGAVTDRCAGALTTSHGRAAEENHHSHDNRRLRLQQVRKSH